MITLETERLYFRPWRPSDYVPFKSYFSDEKQAKYVGGIKNSEESWRLMASYIGHYQLLKYSYLPVVLKESHELIGSMGLWNSEPWPEPELGYWLVEKYQGKGYGKEMGEAVLKFAKDVIRLPSLVSYIDAANKPSVKLAQRLGASYDKEIDLLDFGPHQVYRYW